MKIRNLVIGIEQQLKKLRKELMETNINMKEIKIMLSGAVGMPATK